MDFGEEIVPASKYVVDLHVKLGVDCDCCLKGFDRFEEHMILLECDGKFVPGNNILDQHLSFDVGIVTLLVQSVLEDLRIGIDFTRGRIDDFVHPASKKLDRQLPGRIDAESVGRRE